MWYCTTYLQVSGTYYMYDSAYTYSLVYNVNNASIYMNRRLSIADFLVASRFSFGNIGHSALCFNFMHLEHEHLD